MKHYKRCPICGARVKVEYGNILREHYRTEIGLAYAGGVPSICHGPHPIPTAPNGDGEQGASAQPASRPS